MRIFRNKKPQKGSSNIKDFAFPDVPYEWYKPKKGYAQTTLCELQSGDVVFHTFYKEYYIFAFSENNNLKFYDCEGIFYNTINNSHLMRKATDEETVNFMAKLKQNGLVFKRNRIYKSNRPQNTTIYVPSYGFKGVHRKKKSKEMRKRLGYPIKKTSKEY